MLPNSTANELAPLTPSPISNLPYDVLREIFVHCLPRYFCDNNDIAENAPLVLCWVCSAWRTVALSSPTLWSHVCYDCYAETASNVEFDNKWPKWVIQTCSIELIRWWRQNLRSISPFIDMNVYTTASAPRSRSRVPSSEGSMDEVLTFLASAQYLRTTDSFWWEEMQQNNMSFPNLHTLVLHANNECIYHVFVKAQAVLANIPRHSLPHLRRLHMDGGELHKNVPCIPHVWSTLTHISLENVCISISFWYSLVLCVPNLQWGYLDCKYLDNDDVTVPTACTLPNFTTLFLDCVISDISGLGRILRCAPNLTTLYLGRRFLSIHDGNYEPKILGISSEEMGPLWMDVHHLAHLHIGLPTWVFETKTVDEAEKRLDGIIRFLFSPPCNKWLSPENPACPIQIITIAAEELDNFRDFTASRILKIVENFTNVHVQFTAESVMHEPPDVLIKWGARR